MSRETCFSLARLPGRRGGGKTRQAMARLRARQQPAEDDKQSRRQDQDDERRPRDDEYCWLRY